MLADHGAEVIKAEPPGTGDPLREWGSQERNGRTVWWPVQSRGKRLVTLDLRQAEGQALCLELLTRCDVLIENFRPGTLERWNLSPGRLLEANPRLVIARISGYGQTGPYAQRAGFASVGEAMGGLRYINGFPGQAPARAGISLGDSLASMHAVQGILLALYHREAHGGAGQVIDTSIMESCFAVLDNMVPEYGAFRFVREPNGTKIGYAVPSNVYRSRDQRWVVVAANNDNLWKRLCNLIGRPELLSDERYIGYMNRTRMSDAIDEMLQAWVGERTAAEVDAVLNEAGLVCGPVYSIADIFNDPQYRAREMLLDVEAPEVGAITMPGVVPKLSATPPGPLRPAGWALGADNDAVYRGLLGIDAERLRVLEARSVI